MATALQALDEPLATSVGVTLAESRPDGAPLLDGAVIRLDGRAAAAWVDRLFARAAEAQPDIGVHALRFRSAEALSLIEAAIVRDLVALRHFAAATAIASEPLTAVADVAAFPILQACHREIAAAAPAAWPHGHCPICGAWAALAELRGLERARRLRCARCGGDWQVAWVACPFCRENDHRKLGSLSPEHGAETRRVDKCESCRAYLKTVATLSATPPWGVLLDDAETVDLDLVALDRGYQRPADGGRELAVHLEGHT